MEPARPRRPGPLPRERRRDDAAHAGRLALRGPVRGRGAPARGAGRARALGAGLAGDRGGAARVAAPADRGARLRAQPGAAGPPRPTSASRRRRAGRSTRRPRPCASPTRARRRAPASASRRPPSSHAGALALRAVAVRDGREYREAVQAVEYDHVERRQLLRPAETRVLVLDVRTAPGASVGYVMGSGDALADAIRQMGVPLTLLSADDLLFGDLSRFTTIVTGIRAYETRPDLRSSHGRLMRWVEAGGHLVVQYNRAAFNRLRPGGARPPGRRPEPLRAVPRGRHLRADQRRDGADARARPRPPAAHARRTASAPPTGRAGCRSAGSSSSPRATRATRSSWPRPTRSPTTPARSGGSSSRRRSGKGTWTYVGLALFRQVPAGVPGGWRLLANLVSRPRRRLDCAGGASAGSPRRAACRPRSWPRPRSS